MMPLVAVAVFIFLSPVFAVPAASSSRQASVDELSAMFERTRQVVADFIPAGRSDARRSHAQSFVPRECLVETWCLVRATDCFLGHMTRPAGLWQGHAQYSVVRRVQALCPDRYGDLHRRLLTGPVEPVLFSSGSEPTREAAEENTLRLCRTYRQDWVSAAPACRE